MTTENKTTEFVLPYNPTMFVVHKSGKVGITKSMEIEPVEIKDIDFNVNAKTMEIIKWQVETYKSPNIIFKVEPNETFKEGGKYMANIYLEPHGMKLMGLGNTIEEALDEASDEALKFWKEWEKEANGEDSEDSF